MQNKQYNVLELPEFKAFYSHPFIQKIAQNPKWSVSDKDKRPIDINELRYKNRIIGCNINVPYSTDTLYSTIQTIPLATNHAYYLNAPDEDSFVILDIEPTCPSSLKMKFLDLPYIYAEKSMSGKGYHIIMPIPRNYEDFPIAMTKLKLQEEHRHYEILINHWVTFTRNMLPPSRNLLTLDDWDEIYAQLAKQQKKQAESINFNITEADTVNIPDADRIVDLLVSANAYKKTPEDFHDDMSRFEYGALSYKCKKLLSLLRSSLIKANKHTYTPEELTRILFRVGQLTIPHRDKHDEMRQGMPWLLFMSRKVVGDKLNEEE